MTQSEHKEAPIQERRKQLAAKVAGDAVPQRLFCTLAGWPEGVGHVSTEDVRHCVDGTCSCLQRAIAKNLSAHIALVEKLLEWMPTCSEGSSGYQRRKAVEESIAKLKQTLG